MHILQYPLKGAIMASYSISTRQKDKGWQVIVSYKDRYGKWRQKSKQGFATKRQAKDYGDVIVKDIKENLLLTNNEELANMTFIEFTRLYFDDMKDKLRPNSLKTYRNAIKHLHPIHNIKITDITASIIHSMVQEMPLPTQSKHYPLRCLKTILSHAISHYDLLPRNPVTNSIPYKPKMTRKRIVNAEEIETYLNNSDPLSLYHVAIKLLYYTGMRIGELLGLTWGDIDLDNMTISINKQWVRIGSNNTHGFGQLKTKNSKRILPIPIALVTTLQDYKQQSTHNRVIPINSSSMLYSHINTHINKHSPHDFRHTYATKLLSSGVDIKTVASLLGDTVDTVIKTYIHYSDEMRENARAEIHRIFD